MQNPFIYGEVVPPSAFVNRVDELDRLTTDLAAGQKVFLISPRRYGKSSIIRQALHNVASGGALTVELTVSSYSSYLAFLEDFARAVASVETPLERARKWLMEAVSAARPHLRYERGLAEPGRVAVSFSGVNSARDVSRLASQVFELPGHISAERRRPMVVALDEFQAIANFDGETVEHALRAAVQRQRTVGYIFAGSEPSLMERMLAPRRPFYKAGPVMRLEKIPGPAFAKFIEARFRGSKVRPEPGLGAAIVELAGNLPYDVQRLAHEVWDDVRRLGKRSVTPDDLHVTLKRLLTEQHTVFEAMWQRLTLQQRSVLRAVVLEQGRELLSTAARTRHRLGGASSVQTALAALQRSELIMRDGPRYEVIDSLLREWIVRNTY